MTENTETLFRLALGLKLGQEVPAEVERAFLAFKKPYDRMGGGTISPQIAAIIVMFSGTRVMAGPEPKTGEKSAPAPKDQDVKKEPAPKLEITPGAPPEKPTAVALWNGVPPGKLVKLVNRGVEVDAVFIGPGSDGKLKVKIAGETEACEVPADKVRVPVAVEEF